jgi:hypothetical protein
MKTLSQLIAREHVRAEAGTWFSLALLALSFFIVGGMLVHLIFY